MVTIFVIALSFYVLGICVGRKWNELTKED